MKAGHVIIIIVVVVLLLPLMSLVIFNSAIMRSDTPGVLKGAVQLLWPPKDLHEPLAIETLAFSAAKAESILVYRHKYNGRHEIALLFEKLDQTLYQKTHQPNWLSSVVCSSDGDLVLALESTTASPFLGKMGNGFSVLTYQVPNDVPLDKDLECRFSVSGVDKEFIGKYGPARLYVRKTSDL